MQKNNLLSKLIEEFKTREYLNTKDLKHMQKVLRKFENTKKNIRSLTQYNNLIDDMMPSYIDYNNKHLEKINDSNKKIDSLIRKLIDINNKFLLDYSLKKSHIQAIVIYLNNEKFKS